MKKLNGIIKRITCQPRFDYRLNQKEFPIYDLDDPDIPHSCPVIEINNTLVFKVVKQKNLIRNT